MAQKTAQARIDPTTKVRKCAVGNSPPDAEGFLLDNGFYLALGLGLLMPFLQWLVPALPRTIAWAGVCAAVVVILLEFMAPKMKPPSVSVALFLIAALCVGGAIHFWLQPRQEAPPVKADAAPVKADTLPAKAEAPDKNAISVIGNNNVVTLNQKGDVVTGVPQTPVDSERPDVTLRLVYPDFPALVLVNQSNKLAREIKWSVAVWNLDDPRTYGNPDAAPDAHDPLPIPVAIFDFLRPHTESGAQALFAGQYSRPYVKEGQRLFGSIGVVCPECGRGHTYFVYIVVGKGGWFTEVSNVTEGQLVIPHHFKKQLIQDFYADALKQIPETSRIAIR